MVKFKLPYVWDLALKEKPEMKSILIGTHHGLLKRNKAMRKFAENLYLDPYFRNKRSLLLETELSEGKDAQPMKSTHERFLDLYPDDLIAVDDILAKYANKKNIPIKPIEPVSKQDELLKTTMDRLVKEDFPYLRTSERKYRTISPLIKLLKFFMRRAIYIDGSNYISGRTTIDDYSSLSPHLIEERDKRMAREIGREFQGGESVAGIGLYHCAGVLNRLAKNFVIERI